MTGFMAAVWDLVVTVISVLPWLVIAGMAAMAFSRRKQSKALAIQAVGAIGIFILPCGQWLLVRLMNWVELRYDFVHAEVIIYAFMMFVCLVIFAAGYAMERLAQRKALA